jgi:hypothetical protein
VGGNVITITALLKLTPVTIKVEYTNPDYGPDAKANAVIKDTAEGLKARLIGGRTLQLPVDDVTVTVVDAKGAPVGGAQVKLGPTKTATTGGDGKAIFERVPLEMDGKGRTYTLAVIRDGVDVTPEADKSQTLSTSRTSITVIGQLFSLRVRVIGAAGQGLVGATVEVIKAPDIVVASASTDEGGFAEFDRLVLSDYTVRATYKGYPDTKTATRDDLLKGKVIEIQLPPYTEIFGVPITFSTLLALIIGLILLVLVIAIIISEYRWWRGRRLGVYPPAPPKAPPK